MSHKPRTRLRLGTLSTRGPTAFDVIPDAATLETMKSRLGLSGLRNLRLVGEIAPIGRQDWRLDARLGATVVQPCAVTNAPVTSRIEEVVERRYLADWTEPEEAELEMPEDDTAEPLPDTVDLLAVLEEALALALPVFPRAPDAELGEVAAAPPGAAPIEEEPSPFAALADLKKRMEH
jgi:uncharacterized metal-binding protein YceD (DUF177 family)